MKKLLLILFSVILVTGCSDDGDDVISNPSKEKETTETQREKKDEEPRIFQIGDTADITTDSAGLPYQITVNSFELTTDSVDGLSLEDLNYTAEEGGEFAVVNVTMKNTGDTSFIPQDYISSFLYEEEIPLFSAELDTFKERYDELGPEEEITGNLVFTSTYFDDFDVVQLVYEAEALYNETRFELPMP